MTRRPYINCPLEAALAAKNHGFKFVAKGNLCGEYRELILKYNDGSWQWEFYGTEGEIYIGMKYYIAPESLELLEPKEGDFLRVFNGASNPSYACCLFYDALPDRLCRITITPFGCDDDDLSEVYVGFDSIKIIQRQEKAFPLIQFE